MTPFRSFYQAGIPEDFTIDFFYAYHGEEEGIYLDEMRSLKIPNLRLHFIDDTKQGFLTVQQIREQIKTKNPVDIYFCGPQPMRDKLRKDLMAERRLPGGIQSLGFHFEEFQFGR